MKVLFAIGDAVWSEKVVKEYNTLYNDSLEYKNVFYFKAILEEIKKDKSYDRIVIAERLEPRQNNVLDVADQMLFNNIDSITDEIEDSTIILICDDNRNKNDALIGRLFSLGIYNLLMGEERDIPTLCKLIRSPRNKKEAKDYLKSNPAISAEGLIKDEGVNEVELLNICKYFERLKTPQEYLQSFATVEEQYTQKDLEVIVTALNKQLDNGREIYITLKEDPRYAKYCILSDKDAGLSMGGIGGKQGILGLIKNKKYKADSNSGMQDAIKNDRMHDDRKFREEQQAKLKAEQQAMFKASQQARMKAEQDAINRQQSAPQPNSYDPNANYNATNSYNPNANYNNTNTYDPNASYSSSNTYNPSEIPANYQTMNQLNQKYNSQSNSTSNTDIQNQEDMIRAQQEERLRARQEEQIKAQQEAKNAQNTNSYTSADDLNAMSMQNLSSDYNPNTAYNTANNNMQNNYSPNSYNQGGYNAMNQQYNNGIPNPSFNNYSQPVEPDPYQANTNAYDDAPMTAMPRANVPGGYSKTIAIIGTSGVGTTFITNMLGTVTALKGVRTSMLDMTGDRGLYWYYSEDTYKKADVIESCFTSLSSGVANPIQVGRSKNLSLYTTIPGGKESNIKSYRHKQVIDTARKNCQLLLIDCDFDTPFDYLEQANEIYIVQDLNLLNVPKTLEYFKKLKARNIDWNKLKVVVNNVVKCKITAKKIVKNALSYSSDPTMTYTEEFGEIRDFVEVPLELSNYANYIDTMEIGKINYDRYTDNFKRAMETLSNFAIGTDGKKRGLFG